jgi:elongation factor P--beta-lysine ligase
MNESAWQPSASLEVLHGRAAMLARIRAYFAAQEVKEVQTPMLSAASSQLKRERLEDSASFFRPRRSIR